MSRSTFQIDFTLSIGGYVTSPAGDSLSVHNGAPFSAKDKDLDSSDNNCAATFGGPWW